MKPRYFLPLFLLPLVLASLVSWPADRSPVAAAAGARQAGSLPSTPGDLLPTAVPPVQPAAALVAPTPAADARPASSSPVAVPASPNASRSAALPRGGSEGRGQDLPARPSSRPASVGPSESVISSTPVAYAAPATPPTAETAALPARAIEVAVEVPPGEDVPLVLVPVDGNDGFSPQDLSIIGAEADRFVVDASEGGTVPKPDPATWQSARRQSDELFRTWYGTEATMAMQERRYLEAQQAPSP